MALSEKAKQDIIEEETLRYETRSKLNEAACAGGKCGHGKCGSRKGCRCAIWGWLVAAVLAAILLFHHCPMGRHCGPMGMGKHCNMMAGQMDQDEAVAPAAAPAAKPEAKPVKK